MRVFIDSNIPMYVAGTDHRNKEPARRFLARVQDGEIEGCTSTEVLQEILYRYTAVGRRDLAREVQDANIGAGARPAGPSPFYSIGAVNKEHFWEE